MSEAEAREVSREIRAKTDLVWRNSETGEVYTAKVEVVQDGNGNWEVVIR